MSGEIQYISDTILLEETFQVLAQFNQSGIEKHAWLESLLPSIGNSISTLVGGKYDTPRTIVDLLMPGIFFGIHPILGALLSVSSSFGYDIFAIFDRIKSAILPDIAAGKQVSPEKINSIAQAAVQDVSNTPAEQSEESQADDLLYPLRAMRDNGQLTKEAILGMDAINRSRAEGGWAGPLKGLFNLFTGRRRGNIIVGLLVWFLKTVLLSAGLLAVAGAVLPKRETNPDGSPNTSETSSILAPSRPASTGAGTYVYKQQPGDLWIEDLVGRQPHEMILQWALQSYPSLNQYTSIILNTPSFWNAVKQATEKWRPGQKDISIQDPFKKRDDVVNVFIDDVFRTIKEGSKS